MKFICLEMLRLLVISFTTIEWNLEAMFKKRSLYVKIISKLQAYGKGEVLVTWFGVELLK